MEQKTWYLAAGKVGEEEPFTGVYPHCTQIIRTTPGLCLIRFVSTLTVKLHACTNTNTAINEACYLTKV